MLATYLIVAAIIVAYFFYYAGKWEKPPKGEWQFFDDQLDVIKFGLLAALFWPAVLTIIIVVGPFVLFFRLGVNKREKINAKKAVDSNS